MACVLAVGGAIGGTVAWLVGQSTPVLNSFTYGQIAVSVSESDTSDGDNNPYTNTYAMMPGTVIFKDPVVTVEAGSEDAWLFVEMDQSANFDSFMTYAIAQGWTTLEGVPNVYWREVTKADAAQTFGVIADNAVTVRAEVTAAMLNTLTPQTSPRLTVTAYAVQRAAISTASDAWNLVSSQRSTP